MTHTTLVDAKCGAQKRAPTHIPECMRSEEEDAIAMADQMEVRTGSQGRMN